MLLSLALPVVITAVVLFFASFLSWMVLQLHKKDWVKMPNEPEFLATTAACRIPQGSYMFPGMVDPAEVKSPEFRAKYEAGPRGLLTILPKVNMGQNLGLTMLYFLAVSFGIAYLASMGLKPGADFLTVFRFVFTAGLMAFGASIVSYAIWFHPRVIAYVIEAFAYATLAGVIFALLWPAS